MGSLAGKPSQPTVDRLCPQCGKSFPPDLAHCPEDGSALVDGTLRTSMREDPLIGRVLDGKYRLEGVLGRGGMGTVYAATHVMLGKRVAVKVLRGQFDHEMDLIGRFTQEARAASAIGSAHIVDITDFGEMEGGSAYFVMEYLDGLPLSAALKRSGPMPPARVVAIAEQICRALSAAHAHGIVHRDLKPDNVFLLQRDDRLDFVKILDFGIAKVAGAAGPRTRSGMVFGTPYYMSPEQASGGAIDGRTDVYALGCILFEMLTGKVPYDADSFVAILTKHMMTPVPRMSERLEDPRRPTALDDVVARAMAKSPDDRPQSMDRMRSELIEAVPPEIADVALSGSGPRVVDGPSTVPLGAPLPLPTMPASPTTTGVVSIAPKGPRIAALIGGLLVLGAVGAFFALRGPATTATTVPVPAPVAPIAPPPPAAATTVVPPLAATSEVPAPPVPTRVHLTSMPSGAAVWDGEQQIGATPIDLDRPEAERSLELRAEGHETTSLVIGPNTSDHVNVQLSEAAPAPVRGAARPGSGGRTGRSSDGAGSSGGRHGELRDPFGD